MKPEELDILLSKFYDGETTAEEEELLRTELATSEGQTIYQATAGYFKYVSEARNIEVSEDFDQKVINKIESKPAKTFPMNKILYAVSAIAACIILAIGLNSLGTNFFGNNSNNITAEATVEEQYEATMDALMLVSTNLNKGMVQLDQLKKIDKSMQKLNKLQMLDKIKYIDPDSQTLKGGSL